MIDSEEQQKAEEEFRKLREVMPQYMCVYSADASPLYANDGLLDFFGFNLDDFRAEDFYERAFHPDDLHRVQSVRNQAISRGEGWEVEARIRRKDGEYRWFLIRGKPLRDERGNIVRWFSSGTDIEDRKQAQHELRQLVDAVPQHIIVLDGNGQRLYANKAALDYHGYTLDEFLVVDHSECFHPDDLETYDGLRESAIASGKGWEAEVRLHRKDGQYRWFLMRANPLRDDQGRVIRWYLARTDIEDRKQAERELQQLVDTIPHQVVVLDGEGRRLYFNRVVLDFLGWTPEEVRRPDASRAFHPDDWADFQLARRRFSQGLPFETEARLRRADGQYRWFLFRYNPYRNEQGDIVRWYGTGTDIEDRKQAERELQQLVDSVPDFIVVFAADGTRLYANRVVLDYYGYTLEEFLDEKTLSKRVHPDDLADYLNARQKGFASSLPFQTEVRMLSKTGEYRWFLAQFNPWRNEHGQVARWYATSTDIHDRKQGEEALRRSEAYLEQAQQLSHTASFALDVARKQILYWSAQSYRNYGFDPAQGSVTWNEARNRIHPEDREKLDECLARAYREKTRVDFDFRVCLPGGAIRHLHGQCRPVLNAANEIVELVGTNIDVTEQYNSRMALEKALEENERLKDELYRENLALKDEIDQSSMFEEIVGTSDALRHVLVHVAKVAPTDSTILISGETGTGKELVARAIHKRSQRSSRPFVSVNCAAIPQALIGSELFGHEKGAFTGATERRLGRFELADGGTLFLDEVGDLPAETQIALLRVLQERQFERIGGSQAVAVDVRVIAATNRGLKEALSAGSFRSDLFYRLNVFPVAMPPLRDRKGDIPLLVEYLIDRYTNKLRKKFKNIQKQTMELLQAYSWPGNIRELQNVIERAVILCDGETFMLDESWLQSEPSHASYRGDGLARMGASDERKLIEKALTESHGRVAGPAGAAARLGIPRSTLETKIRKLGIKKHKFNPD